MTFRLEISLIIAIEARVSRIKGEVGAKGKLDLCHSPLSLILPFPEFPEWKSEKSQIRSCNPLLIRLWSHSLCLNPISRIDNEIMILEKVTFNNMSHGLVLPLQFIHGVLKPLGQNRFGLDMSCIQNASLIPKFVKSDPLNSNSNISNQLTNFTSCLT